MDAQLWSPLGLGLEYAPHVDCKTLSFFGNHNLIAGGTFQSAGGVHANNIAQWNGSHWSALGNGFPNDSNFRAIYALANYDGNLYAGGFFDSAGSVASSNVAMWNGANWSAASKGIPGGDATSVNALIVYNGNLIAGGYLSYDTAIYKFNGTTWTGMPCYFSNATVSCFTVYNDTLYAGGFFWGNTGTFHGLIAKWSGSTWNLLADVSSIDTLEYTQINSLCVYNGNLYAAGGFDSIGGIAATNISKWNGVTWGPLGSGLAPAGWPMAFAMATYQDNLYVGGSFCELGGQTQDFSSIARWNDTAWESVGDSDCGPGEMGVATLLADSDNLYAGGSFTQIGGANAYRIAALGDLTGIKNINDNNLISISPNPNSGKFFVSLQNANHKYMIDIYDVDGDKISRNSLNSDKTEFDLSTVDKGIYFYRITSLEGETLAAGKIVVQ
jgi:hypothetical protein